MSPPLPPSTYSGPPPSAKTTRKTPGSPQAAPAVPGALPPPLSPEEEMKKKKVKQAMPSTYYQPAPGFLSQGNVKPMTTRKA